MNDIDKKILSTGITTIIICKLIQIISKQKNGHFVSYCHAMFQISYILILFFYNTNLIFLSCFDMIHTRIDTTLQLSVLLFYTLYDTLENNNKIDMIIHHVIVIICCMIGLNLESHQLIGMFMMLNEASTPFLNLIKMNVCKSISEILFLVTFFVFRLFLLPYLIFLLWPCVDNRTTFIIFIIVCGLFCLNLHWGRLIYLQCMKRFSRKSKS
jgi:hypothetical protein